jgi:hypothetical protein
MSHVIHQVRIELSAAGRGAAALAQEEVSRAFQEEIPDALEILFDARFSSGNDHRLERIELDLGRLPLRQFRQVFVKKLFQALNQLERQITARNVFSFNSGTAQVDKLIFSDASRAGSAVEAFLHFITTGALPWWFPLSRWREEIPSELIADERFNALHEKLFEILSRQPSRLFRLVPFPEIIALLFKKDLPRFAASELFSSSFANLPGRLQLRVQLVLWFLDHPSAQEPERTLRSILRRLLQVETFSRMQFEQLRSMLATFERISSGAPRESHLIRQFSELLDLTLSSEAQPPVEVNAMEEIASAEIVEPDRTVELVRPQETISSADGLPTPSAGLVLLHPFIPRFFKRLGWLGDRDRLATEHQWHAVQALHFLARNRPARDEGELVLEKTLCGIDLAEGGELPEFDDVVIAEMKALLRSVVTHWRALKETSPEGLQEAFLDRPGLLYLSERPRIHIENRAYDILLNKVPWALDRLHFPWLRFPMEIHWPISR